MPGIKVTATTVDGVSLERGKSVDLNAANTDFDKTGTDFTTDTVRDVLLEIGNFSFESITEAETYFDATEESTTANNWVTAFQQETDPKSGGDYIIIHSSAIKQSQTNKSMEYRIQYRLNATGSWLEFITIPYEGRGDSYLLQTGLNLVTTGVDDTVEVRFQYGQTNAGGTASIKNKGFIIYKIRD